MFDRLVDAIIQFLDLFRFWVVVMVYEEAVLYRLGKPVKVLRCRGRWQRGFYFIWPFGIDDVFADNVVRKTVRLPVQNFTTKDGKSIGVLPVITYLIKDILTFQVKVEDAKTVLTDSSAGEIRAIMCEKTWEEIHTSGAALDEEITKAVRREAFKWGMEVMKVRFPDLAPATCHRIMGEMPWPQEQQVDE